VQRHTHVALEDSREHVKHSRITTLCTTKHLIAWLEVQVFSTWTLAHSRSGDALRGGSVRTEDFSDSDDYLKRWVSWFGPSSIRSQQRAPPAYTRLVDKASLVRLHARLIDHQFGTGLDYYSSIVLACFCRLMRVDDTVVVGHARPSTSGHSRFEKRPMIVPVGVRIGTENVLP
jgi:hypothetical protein